MKLLVCDIEANAIENPSRLWCICAKDFTTKERFEFLCPDVVEDNSQAFQELVQQYDKVVFHFGYGYDLKVIKDLLSFDIDPSKSLDTLILSRMEDYDRKGGHSLEAWGNLLNFPKNLFSDFSKLSDELVSRCHTDVDITERILQRYIPVLDKPYVKLEHDIQFLLEAATERGFWFNNTKAEELLDTVVERKKVLEDQFQKDFAPELTVVNTLKYRTKEDGTEFATVLKAKDKYPKTEVQDDNLLCYDYVSFNPGSSKDRIERLWDAGWKPFEKTKGHLKLSWEKDKSSPEYTERKERFETYGWTVSEDNLKTLPESAPESAQNIAQWLTLEGRRSSLVEWLGCYNEATGRIHGQMQGIGAWTQRLSHRNPNQANISSVFLDEPRNAVERVKQEFDGQLRELWGVPEGSWQVGTDADGIQLRVLTHIMQSEEYREAILSGDKDLGTDIHNMNRKALYYEHITRNMAKTFIYAFLLGAGKAKVANILSLEFNQAAVAIENFTNSIPGLSNLKNTIVPQSARRGFFVGLDGRKVKTPSQHKTLAGMLQNGEAIIMKTASLIWKKELDKLQIENYLLTFPHDEWQTEIVGTYEEAEEAAKVQRQALKEAGEKLELFIPIEGSSSIGKNWKDTH